MYLTQILLDQKNRQTLAALASPSKFHGAIEAAFPARGSETSGGSTAAPARNIFCSSVRHRRISRRLRLSLRRRVSIGRQSHMIRCSPAFCRAAAGSFACVQTRHTVSLQDRGSAGASARTAPRSISLRG